MILKLHSEQVKRKRFESIAHPPQPDTIWMNWFTFSQTETRGWDLEDSMEIGVSFSSFFVAGKWEKDHFSLWIIISLEYFCFRGILRGYTDLLLIKSAGFRSVEVLFHYWLTICTFINRLPCSRQFLSNGDIDSEQYMQCVLFK